MKKIKMIFKYVSAFSVFVFLYLGLYFFHVKEQVMNIPNQLNSESKSCPSYGIDVYLFLKCAFRKYEQVLILAKTHVLRNEAMASYAKIIMEAKKSLTKPNNSRTQFLYALYLIKGYDLWARQSQEGSAESVFFAPLDMCGYLKMRAGKARAISLIRSIDIGLNKNKFTDVSPELITEFRLLQKRIN